tara:strand:+ start:27 stop:428 length:402 start_codon:yes stop_codon:yes gene_type:complete
MENSPLRFLKDFDIITMINKEVVNSKRKLAMIFHTNAYKDRIHNNYNFFEKILIDDTFWRINLERITNKDVAIIPPEFPFINNRNKTINVKHAIRVFQKHLLEVEDESYNIRLPCGTISNGAQCLCDICIEAF